MDKIKPINHEKVKFKDRFWAPRIQINRTQTIPHQYELLEKTDRLEALKLDWDKNKPDPHPFWDSDVAKWIEAASYSLASHFDAELDALIDDVIDLLKSAQQEDGYLNTFFTIVRPEDRWTDLRDAHELYCAGHLMEAGVAHFRATGKRNLLNIVCKYADYIDEVFGPGPNQKRGYPGHQEIELALVKLYRVTDEKRYLELSKFFVDERGTEPHYFDIEEKERGNSGYFGNIAHYFGDRKEYNQSHKPVREQTEPVGHSVRAMYLYSAMADLAYEIGDTSLKEVCERLWESLVTKKLYITGGIGASGGNEGFSDNYDLPNKSYAETCAAIGSVFWNHRMLQLDCDRKYADLIEQTLYNGVLSGVSLDGKKFFYANPLESRGNQQRNEWFGVACCPPNIARLLSSLGQYVYSYKEDSLMVHLYAETESTLEINQQPVSITQKTTYPWDPEVNISLEMDKSIEFNLKLRIPSWCKDSSVSINGQSFEYSTEDLNKGYLELKRRWESGDTITLILTMPVTKRYSNPNVSENVGKVALQRGPILYCLEGVDHNTSVSKIFISDHVDFTTEHKEDFLNGVTVLKGDGQALEDKNWQGKLYDDEKPSKKPVQLTAIPYYAWNNREVSDMVIWINNLNK